MQILFADENLLVIFEAKKLQRADNNVDNRSPSLLPLFHFAKTPYLPWISRKLVPQHGEKQSLSDLPRRLLQAAKTPL